MRNVRQLDSSQHMCGIGVVFGTKIIVSLVKLRSNVKLRYMMHLAMEDLNLVAEEFQHLLISTSDYLCVESV
jgi:hypothetical protein